MAESDITLARLSLSNAGVCCSVQLQPILSQLADTLLMTQHAIARVRGIEFLSSDLIDAEAAKHPRSWDQR